MEAIDKFKYTALLAKLESIKGTKKPIHDFIKELAELSNNFLSQSNEYKEQPLTQMYAFMLASRALTYDKSIKQIPKCTRENIIRASQELIISNPLVDKSNTVDIFKYWDNKLFFTPRYLKKLYRIDNLTELLSNPVTCYYFYIKELKVFTYDNYAAKLFLEKHNPNSKLAKAIEFNQLRHDKTIEELKQLTNLYTGVLNEHNCTSSKTE
jgi:hypothetical protein